MTRRTSPQRTPRHDSGTGGAVVVTGASSGIGRATALALDARGYQVFAGVRRDADEATRARDASPRLQPILLDVTLADTIAAAARAVQAAVDPGGLVGLVNCAGAAAPAPLEYVPLETLREQLEVNLVGQLATIQALLPLIRRAHGHIVNGSVAVEWAGRLRPSIRPQAVAPDRQRSPGRAVRAAWP